MSTQLGKELRKLRIDLGVTLMGLSEMVNLSPAFLSAIETGRKRVPDSFLENLASKVPAVAEQRQKFEALINQARNEVRLPLDEARFEDAELATALARRFSGLSDEQKKMLRNIIGE